MSAADARAAVHHSISVAFSGSQRGMTKPQRVAVSSLLRLWGASLLVHGDCVGADAEADSVAHRLCISRVTMPSNIEAKRAHCERRGALELYPPRPPLDRNRLIARWCDVLVACPREGSRGTWDTARWASAMFKPVVVVGDDGKCIPYNYKRKPQERSDHGSR